ncbi:MAG: hypothetical protein KID09_30915, partial [Paenibacillus macerans]|nr:hypothetical protein [Paenibacillus macerans]
GAVMQLIKKDPNIVREAENALNAAARERLESDLYSMSPRQAAEFASSRVDAQEALQNETPAEADSFQMK